MRPSPKGRGKSGGGAGQVHGSGSSSGRRAVWGRGVDSTQRLPAMMSYSTEEPRER
jgi:hypothetical protein